MKTKQIVISLFLPLSMILAACSSDVVSTAVMTEKDMPSESMPDKEASMMQEDATMMDNENEAMTEHSGDNMMEDDDMTTEDPMMDDQEMEKDDMSGDAMMVPDWFNTPLVNVQTGETFSVADLKGKVVLVETMAIWCSNCLKQQGQVQELHKLLGERENFISLGVDIDPNENGDALKSYIDKNDFGWWYTVAPADLAREIGQLYGDQFLNPPSTPMLIIDSHGEVHPLPFGIKSAESLLDALQSFLDGEM